MLVSLNTKTLPPGLVTGALVYWDIAGATSLSKLAAAWTAEGLPEDLLPGELTPSRALRRAAHEVSAQRRLVRPLAGRKGYAVVDERADDAHVEHDQILTIRLVPESDAPGAREVPMCDPPDHPCAAPILAKFVEFDSLPYEVVSTWLSQRVMPAVGAVTLRDRGGLYYVGPAGKETVDKIDRALRTATSHKIFRVPAMHVEEVVESVLAGLKAEAERLTAKTEAAAADETKGPGALRSEVDRMESFFGKVQGIEELFSVRLDDVRESLVTAQGTLTIALAEAERRADEEKARREAEKAAKKGGAKAA